MHARLHEASGNDWSFGKPMDTWGSIEIVALLVFFALIALANSQLAIAPAIRERNLRRAMQNGFLLGCAAYATYSVPIFAAIANWPAALIPIDILTGGLLSLATSTIVAWWALRPSGGLRRPSATGTRRRQKDGEHGTPPIDGGTRCPAAETRATSHSASVFREGWSC